MWNTEIEINDDNVTVDEALCILQVNLSEPDLEEFANKILGYVREKISWEEDL